MRAVDPSFFDNVKISLFDDISLHIQWIIEKFYKIKYPNVAAEFDIARYAHGGTHVSRGALFLNAFANLYRRWGDDEALNLTEEDLKLLMIAFIFHDSAREDDGEDKLEWEQASALNGYWYLTKVLGVNHDKAKKLAEALVNKDIDDNKTYFHLEINDGILEWRKETLLSDYKKNIFEKLVKDADCLDVIRAADKYDPKQLDFYRYIACNDSNEVALREMAALVVEARSLIETQGDGKDVYLYRRAAGAAIKRKYENAENCFKNILADLYNPEYPLPCLAKLYNNNTLLDKNALMHLTLIDDREYDPDLGITNENLMRALNNGHAYVRGMRFSAWVNKDTDESAFAKEIRKTSRSRGSSRRSLSAIGYGNPLFSNWGLLLLSIEKANICELENIDSGSGYASKSSLIGSEMKVTDEDLKKFRRQLMLGGSMTEFDNGQKKLLSKHNEILYDLLPEDVKRYSGIVFSLDTNLSNDAFYETPFPVHPYAPILEAIFGQREFKNITGISLPLIEYSNAHHFFRIRKYSWEDILKMWEKMCEDYIVNMLEKEKIAELICLEIDEIKAFSMYDNLDLKAYNFGTVNGPADVNYDSDERQAINQIVMQLKQKCMADYFNKNIFNKISLNELALIRESSFDESVLKLLTIYPNELSHEVVKNINSELLDNEKLITILIKDSFDFNIMRKKKPDSTWEKNAKEIINAYFDDQKFSPEKVIPFNRLLLLMRLVIQLNLQDVQKIIYAQVKTEIKNLSFKIMYKEIDLFQKKLHRVSFCQLIMQSYLFGLLPDFLEKFHQDYLNDIDSSIDKQDITVLYAIQTSLDRAGFWTEKTEHGKKIKGYIMGLFENYEVTRTSVSEYTKETYQWDQISSADDLEIFSELKDYFSAKKKQEIKNAIISRVSSGNFYEVRLRDARDDLEKYLIPAINDFSIYDENDLIKMIKTQLKDCVMGSRTWVLTKNGGTSNRISLVEMFEYGVNGLEHLSRNLPPQLLSEFVAFQKSIQTLLNDYHAFGSGVSILVAYARGYLKLERCGIVTEIPEDLLKALKLKFEATQSKLSSYDKVYISNLISKGEVINSKYSKLIIKEEVTIPTASLRLSANQSNEAEFQAIRQKNRGETNSDSSNITNERSLSP